MPGGLKNSYAVQSHGIQIKHDYEIRESHSMIVFYRFLYGRAQRWKEHIYSTEKRAAESVAWIPGFKAEQAQHVWSVMSSIFALVVRTLSAQALQCEHTLSALRSLCRHTLQCVCTDTLQSITVLMSLISVSWQRILQRRKLKGVQVHSSQNSLSTFVNFIRMEFRLFNPRSVRCLWMGRETNTHPDQILLHKCFHCYCAVGGKRAVNTWRQVIMEPFKKRWSVEKDLMVIQSMHIPKSCQSRQKTKGNK